MNNELQKLQNDLDLMVTQKEGEMRYFKKVRVSTAKKIFKLKAQLEIMIGKQKAKEARKECK